MVPGLVTTNESDARNVCVLNPVVSVTDPPVATTPWTTYSATLVSLSNSPDFSAKTLSVDGLAIVSVAPFATTGLDEFGFDPSVVYLIVAPAVAHVTVTEIVEPI
jgi:hypothetical protein